MNSSKYQKSSTFNTDVTGFWEQAGIPYSQGRALWVEFSDDGAHVYIKLVEPELVAKCSGYQFIGIKRFGGSAMLFHRMKKPVDDVNHPVLYELIPPPQDQTLTQGQPVYWLNAAERWQGYFPDAS